MNNEWLIEPGSTKRMTTQVKELFDAYIEQLPNKTKVMCMNDANEVLYFIILPEEDSPELAIDRADVAIFDGEEYLFLPEDMALELAHAYLFHMRKMSQAYRHLGILGGEGSDD